MPTITAVDITLWERDFDFPVFPQGARAKWAVISPADQFNLPIHPSRRHLFKYSLPRYPSEFWSEIVASHIGEHFDIDVPKAYPAFDRVSDHAGALIEWFYEDRIERFVQAGDFFQLLVPGFDRKRGTQHDFVTVMDIRELLSRYALDPRWYEKWGEMLFLDALTGNGDRHQDNWGIVVSTTKNPQQRQIVLAPAFDNGSSLGREFQEVRLSQLDARWVQRYIAKGRHHIKWHSSEPKGQPHLALLLRLGRVFPEVRRRLRSLALLSIEPIIEAVHELSALPFPIPLSQERADFMERLLRARFGRLQAALI